MSKHWLRRYFPLIALAALIPWPVAYAYDSVSAAPAADIRIQAAAQAALPAATVFGNAINNITPGELFSLDATSRAQHFTATILLANTDELVDGFRQITVRIGVQVMDREGKWQNAVDALGAPLPNAPLTLLKNEVSFDLAGGALYRINVEGGSLAARPAKNRAFVAPRFDLTVD